jgi:malate dehydrogenase (oxaloacetate-decarboxylating)
MAVEVRVAGDALLRSPLTNKGTAFGASERAELGLSGLLPPRVETLDEQVSRAYAAFGGETSPLGRFRFLRRMQDTNEVLFFALLHRHLREMLPVVYTPTVGEGVERFSEIYERPRGLSLSIDAGDPAAAIAAWPHDDVRMIVATDSSAILGIGDQGYNGLAIAIGKLALYTVAGAVDPFHTLPVVLDVGTDRAALRDDPAYLGLRRPRARGAEHMAFVASFVRAVRARWPRAIIQWEDFGKDTAFAVLDAFREVAPSFNDDIQGTGAVALSGLLAAAHGKGSTLADERFLVFGAGAGGIGVARAIRAGLEHAGLDRAAASARIFVVDSRGLLVQGRSMEDYKKDFAQPRAALATWTTAAEVPTLRETIANGKVTALLGLSGQPGTFDEAVVRAVAANTTRPLVFALSNPTSACEAVPADIVRWSEGRAIVATGSPFDPVSFDGRERPVGQGNNAFIFPGLGFGALLAEARTITDGMVAEAAYALADLTIERYAASGQVYPPVEDLHEATIRVASRVARRAIADGVGGKDLSESALDPAFVHRSAWAPHYVPFRRSAQGQATGSTLNAMAPERLAPRTTTS